MEFLDNDFIIYRYNLQYFSIDNDDSANIHLNKNDFINKKFNYYAWELNSGWIDNLEINNKNIVKIKNFAHQIKNIDSYLSSRILKKIKKFTANNHPK